MAVGVATGVIAGAGVTVGTADTAAIRTMLGATTTDLPTMFTVTGEVTKEDFDAVTVSQPFVPRFWFE